MSDINQDFKKAAEEWLKENPEEAKQLYDVKLIEELKDYIPKKKKKSIVKSFTVPIERIPDYSTDRINAMLFDMGKTADDIISIFDTPNRHYIVFYKDYV